MKKYKIKSVPTKQGAYIRRRIAKNRHRAEFVGIIYLFATIILAALACLPMLTADNAPVGIAKLMQVFQPFSLSSVGDLIKLINAALYALMLLGLVINVLRSLANLGNLFKKKVSRVYGLNANLDAMENMGALFSGSLASIINFHFLIYILAGGAQVEMMLLVALGVGLFVHFLCGILSTKTSVFEKDAEVGVREHKRMFSRALPFVRNLLQTAGALAMMYFFLYSMTIYNYIPALMAENGITLLIENLFNYIPLFLQLLTAIWLMVLVKHATGISEYDFRGPEAEGQHNFRVFSFFTVLTVGGTIACRFLFGEAFFTIEGQSVAFSVVQGLDMNSVILVAIAFVAFLFDFIVKLRLAYEDDDGGDYIDWNSIPEVQKPAQQAVGQAAPQPQVRYIRSYMDGRTVEQAPSMPQYRPAPPAPIYINTPAAAPQAPQPPVLIQMPPQMPMQPQTRHESGESPYLEMMKQQIQTQQMQAQQMQMGFMQANQMQAQQMSTMQNQLQQMQMEQDLARKQAWMAGVGGAVAGAAVGAVASSDSDSKEEEDIMMAPLPEEPVEEEREPRDWQIKCPSCQKTLTVSDEDEYHRCPACGKVLQLNIKQVNVEVEDEPEAEADGEESASKE